MYRFECDYSEGAHPAILKLLSKTNFEQTSGYSEDVYCIEAGELIKKECQCKNAAIHFLVGGTQANFTVISHILSPYQGVLCADTGHINVHETGAIEATGHKVLPLFSNDGKISAKQIEFAVRSHYSDSNYEHTVQPGMVYISNPTENGTIYSKSELTAISAVCKNNNIPLFLDGARLGYGLMSPKNDLTLPEIARLCDIFYIGGTKVGALFGEAVVITNSIYQKDFRYSIKQHGGMLAKGRLLGLQFKALFTDNLYYEISKSAVENALKIRDAFIKKGYNFLYDSYTNQQFPIIPNDKLKILSENYTSSFWGNIDESHTAVRFCTSWATTNEAVNSLVSDILNL